jgi:hypothetical protein
MVVHIYSVRRKWEMTGFAQVSSVETTVYHSRAEKSRVERYGLRQLELTTETGT